MSKSTFPANSVVLEYYMRTSIILNIKVPFHLMTVAFFCLTSLYLCVRILSLQCMHKVYQPFLLRRLILVNRNVVRIRNTIFLNFSLFALCIFFLHTEIDILLLRRKLMAWCDECGNKRLSSFKKSTLIVYHLHITHIAAGNNTYPLMQHNEYILYVNQLDPCACGNIFQQDEAHTLLKISSVSTNVKW